MAGSLAMSGSQRMCQNGKRVRDYGKSPGETNAKRGGSIRNHEGADEDDCAGSVAGISDGSCNSDAAGRETG